MAGPPRGVVVVVGCWLLVVGCWLLVVGCWLLVGWLVGCWLLVDWLLVVGVVVVVWLHYSKRIIIVRWADLSDFFSFIFVGKMCVFVSRPMKIVTFLRKNGYLPKRVVDFPRERDTFRNNIMEIVEDFEEKRYNNNGKPWKSSRILRVNPIFFIFISFFIIFLHFFVFFIFSFFHFFFIYSFFHFFIFFFIFFFKF